MWKKLKKRKPLVTPEGAAGNLINCLKWCHLYVQLNCPAASTTCAPLFLYIWVDYLIVQVFMCTCMFMFTHRDCRVTGKIMASTPFVAIPDKWQFKGWISHLFHLRQTCTDTNSERCRFILLRCDRLRNGLYGSTVLFTWLEACKQKRLGGRQHCTHRDVKAGHASTRASFKYLHDLMGQEKCGLCVFESLKPPVRLYFISPSTYISGGNMFKGMKNVAASKSSHCCLKEFDFQ